MLFHALTVLGQATAPGPITESGGLYLAVLAAALPSVLGLLVGLMQWLGKRTVDREDKDRDELKARLKEHEDRFGRMERSVDDLRTQNERRFGEVDRSLIELRTELKAGLSVVESLRGQVQELKSIIDVRFEKQADFYRAQLKEQLQVFTERLEKLEFGLRQDISRALADSLSSSGRRKR